MKRHPADSAVHTIHHDPGQPAVQQVPARALPLRPPNVAARHLAAAAAAWMNEKPFGTP